MAQFDGTDPRDRVRFGDARVPLLSLALALLLSALGLALADAQARDGLRASIAVRTEDGARFVDSQTRDLLDRETSVAQQYLAGRRVSTADFERASRALSLDRGVLLDEQGRALFILPRNPAVIGTRLTDLPHLAQALSTGLPAVSSVFESASDGTPIVGLAVPFPSAAGRRVFAGGFDVQASILGQYLRTAAPLAGAEPFLLDGEGQVIARDPGAQTSGTASAAVPLAFTRALEQGEGSADSGGRDYVLTASAVPGTTWTLLVATPDSVAFASVPSRTQLVAVWLMLALVGAVAAGSSAMLRMRRRQWSTAEARRTRELEHAHAELESTHHQVSDLVSMISHDVRQPLVALRGFSDVVIEDWSQLGDDLRLDLVSRMARAGERAEQMLEDSLTATAILGGGVEPRPTAVPLSEAVRDVVDHLTTDRSAVTVRGAEGLAAQVDRGHFVQVITNLLTNAAKYGAPPITVECARQGTDRVVIRVSDQGEGIPAEFVPHLFDRYSRAESARRSGQRGTGLGLYIARAVLEANGGTIDYEPPGDSPGAFVVTLPAAVAAVAAVAAAAVAAGTAAGEQADVRG